MPLALCASSVAAADEGDTPSAGADVESQAASGEGGFQFGSYGRVMAGSDLNGGRGRPFSVVSYGPRLIEAPYLELDLGYSVIGADGATFRTQTTLAITDALFHLDGDFDGAIALRNAYVEASRFGIEGLSVWAGSRMVRGDDIYLLDFWPLDNLNTVGGGAGLALGDSTDISVHGGLNQLSNTFQFQTVEVAAPQFGTEDVVLLDRVRALASVRLEHRFLEVRPGVGIKTVLYADYQALGEGEYENEDDVRLPLPSDLGYTVGAEVGTWGFAEDGFVNVFGRFSRGLAAYGELAIPYGFDTNRRVTTAQIVRLGTSAGARWDRLGVLAGAYVQWFRDGDDVTYDPDDYGEGVIVLRPMIEVTDHFRQAFEVSYQRRVPQGLSARTDTYLEAAMWQFGVMPTLAPGPELFARPELRLLYTVSLLNDGALDRYPEEDPRAGRDVQHFVGVGAEWWFNSSTY